MPKIVDRDKLRREIVAKATPVFSEFGYSGLGMRQIADHLGMSKSALYHYFPSKEDLFAACTAFVVERDGAAIPGGSEAGTSEQKAAALINLFAEIEKNFQGEMYLLMDYIRGKSPSSVARDKNMKLANERYLDLVAGIVGKDAASHVLIIALGGLLQRLFDGRKTRLEDIEDWLVDAIKRGG